MKCSVGLMILCIRRLPEDCTLVPKHVELILIMNCVIGFVFYYTLLSAFVGQYTEHTKMQGMSNIKLAFIVVMSGSSLCNSTSQFSVLSPVQNRTTSTVRLTALSRVLNINEVYIIILCTNYILYVQFRFIQKFI